MNIFEAVRSNDIEKVKNLLKDGAGINTRNYLGWTALEYACLYGHYDIAHLLLKNGADVNTRDNDGWTPLYSASLDGHYDIVRLLLKNGADVNIKSYRGWTPLHDACCWGYYDLVHSFLPPFSKEEDKELISFNNFWRTI